MLIGLLGAIFVALWINILYYETMYRKPIKKDKDLIPAYTRLERKRKKRLFETFNDSGVSEGKPGIGPVDDFNAR